MTPCTSSLSCRSSAPRSGSSPAAGQSYLGFSGTHGRGRTAGLRSSRHARRMLSLPDPLRPTHTHPPAQRGPAAWHPRLWGYALSPAQRLHIAWVPTSSVACSVSTRLQRDSVVPHDCFTSTRSKSGACFAPLKSYGRLPAWARGVHGTAVLLQSLYEPSQPPVRPISPLRSAPVTRVSTLPPSLQHP